MIVEKIIALNNLVPNGNFEIIGNTIISHRGKTIPSKAEIDVEMIRMQDEYNANQYQRDRQYPNLGEQLDMLFHDMTADKGSKTGEWYKAIAKVKADNPK